MFCSAVEGIITNGKGHKRDPKNKEAHTSRGYFDQARLLSPVERANSSLAATGRGITIIGRGTLQYSRTPPPPTSRTPLRIPGSNGGGGSSSRLGHNQKPSATIGERHLQARHVRTVAEHGCLGPVLRVYFNYGRRGRMREAHCWPQRHVPILVLK